MDPDATLADVRDAIADVRRAAAADVIVPHRIYDAACCLAEAADVLDVWLTTGGFLPADWQRAQSR